jgi:hypothetical protein
VIWTRSEWRKDPDSGKRIRKMHPESEWHVQERPDLAIVDRAAWNKVRERSERRPQGLNNHRGAPRRYPLSGLLKCGTCGGSDVVFGAKNARGFGKSGRYYLCSTYHLGGTNVCTNGARIGLAGAEKELVGFGFKQLLSEDAITRAVTAIRKSLGEHPQKPDVDLTQIAVDIAKVRGLVMTGKMSAELAEPVFAKLETRREALVREAHRLARPPLLSGWKGAKEEYRAHARGLAKDLRGKDADVARAAPGEPLRHGNQGRAEGEGSDGGGQARGDQRATGGCGAVVFRLSSTKESRGRDYGSSYCPPAVASCLNPEAIRPVAFPRY